jgi:glycosyltransferase involved in cell wall biosynthesis
MRVLTLTNLYPSPLAPHRAPYIRHQLRLLAEQHAVRVIAPVLWTDEWTARRRALPALPAGRRVVSDGLVVDHPRYWYTPKILRRLYGQFLLASVRATFEEVVAEFQPDVVFAPWAYPDGYAAVRLAQRANLPVVVQVHGSDLRELARYPARKAGTALALTQADGVIAVSRELAERVVGLGAQPHRVRVVIDGVDRDTFCPGGQMAAQERIGFAPDVRHLLFVGNLVPVKGLDVLLAALQRMRTAESWHLHVVGDGLLRKALQSQALALGLVGQVRFYGSLAHAELPDWYRAADLLVLSSRSEGVPNVLLEAAACGLPFVATDVGGIPEIAALGQSRLVPPEDPTALAEAIGDMLRVGRDLGDAPGPRDRRDAVADIAAGLEAAIHERCGNASPKLGRLKNTLTTQGVR